MNLFPALAHTGYRWLAMSVFLFVAASACGQTNFTLLKNFGGGADLAQGVVPGGGVILATDGWLYGTTESGGTNGFNGGTVFKLKTDGANFSVIKHFAGFDGLSPSAPVIEGSDGFLYGTTYEGGTSNFGTVFKLGKEGKSFAVLHHFLGGSDGKNLRGSVIEGTDGYLYGMTYFGSTNTRGTVFKVDKAGNNYAVIHSFTGNPDGQQPLSRLLQASNGVLYGTTTFGGSSGNGTIFKLSSDGSGYQVLYHFATGGSGYSPVAGLIEGSDGLLYGTTQYGGNGGYGVVYSLTKAGTGYKAVRSFASTNLDLGNPISELIESPEGVLYGAAPNRGTASRGGLFRLNKDGTDYAVLRNFLGTGNSGDGDQPKMAFALGVDGFLYGTTQFGGVRSSGCVFILSPAPQPPRHLAFVQTNGTGGVQFAGTAAARYVIELSTNLNQWSNLVTVAAPNHGVVNLPQSTGTNGAGFYRVRLQ